MATLETQHTRLDLAARHSLSPPRAKKRTVLTVPHAGPTISVLVTLAHTRSIGKALGFRLVLSALNGYRHPISAGKLEAINRKIGTLQRNAYGYRDDEYLRLRILNLYNSTYAPIG